MLKKSRVLSGLFSKQSGNTISFCHDIPTLSNDEISSLLQRTNAEVHREEILSYIENQKVLISGAAGSIGTELARQCCSYNPKSITLLDINETDLAFLETELTSEFPNINITMSLCDISNDRKLQHIFTKLKPDVVFHAAAYKHVPVMERFPEEAVRVNVLGTANMVRFSKDINVKYFVLISTDKAVNPTGIMGSTKRIAEYLVSGANNFASGNFVVVRFGNVLGSRGSVLQIFLKQISKGGPITITHPDMTRYFMTIRESVMLVLQAAAFGKNGDVFVLDMGKQIKIIDLVERLLKLFRLKAGKDIDIIFTGVREGEKLKEELFSQEEGMVKTSHKKIFKARLGCLYNEALLEQMTTFLGNLPVSTSITQWKQALKKFVPTYCFDKEESTDSDVRVNDVSI